MKCMGLAAILVVLSTQKTLAQEYSSEVVQETPTQPGQVVRPQVDLRTQLILGRIYYDRDLALSDSLPRPVTRRLLPNNMSFMEEGLWGENGLLRSAGLASPLTPESRTSELSLRRTMLSVHQIGGFATFGLMVSAVYTGQRIIDGDPGYRSAHQGFAAGTIAAYSFTGLLSILSPPPVIRRDEFSTTTLHKTLAWVHAAGMIITPILASMIGRNSDLKAEHVHQVSAYITTTVFAASMITIMF